MGKTSWYERRYWLIGKTYARKPILGRNKQKWNRQWVKNKRLLGYAIKICSELSFFEKPLDGRESSARSIIIARVDRVNTEGI